MTEERNPLWEKLERGDWVVCVELDPPVDDVIQPFLDGVAAFRDVGADAVTIADSPVGRPRADSSLLACKLKRELGVEALPHMTCRDRNEIATKALLLGLSIEDVHNVLLVTGDPASQVGESRPKTVFHFNSRKLARYVAGLNETVLRHPFRVFAALNVNAVNFPAELRRAGEKERCGVSGFLTQPILSPEALDNLKRARATLKGKLLGGVFPVVSHKNALFLDTQVSGMRLSPALIQRYEGADRERGEALAEEISAQVIRAIRPYTDGVYLMTPFQRISLMTRLIAHARGAGEARKEETPHA